MKDSEFLNDDLKAGLKYQMDSRRKEVLALDLKYPEIAETRDKLLSFDVLAYQEHLFNLLKNKLVGEWIEYQKKMNITAYDMLYFEYHEQSKDEEEARSCAIAGLEGYDVYNGKYEMGSGVQQLWEGGNGPSLEPFALTEPMSYDVIGEDRWILIMEEDDESGGSEIWSFIISICEYAFHCAFSKADQQGLFIDLNLKEDGAFVLTMHDDGTHHRPFYVKG